VQEVVVLVREDSPGDKRLVAYVVPAGAEETKRRRSEEARKRGDEETAHITLNSKPETRNPEPETRNPKLETRNFPTDLRHFLKAKLPDYMLPAAFVLLEALPLTPNGKVDRRALPVPDQSRAEGVETFIAPRTPVEERVAGIWAELLRLERVGVNDNFFELGGHSLLATQVISRLRSAFQVDLPLRRLFESPTIAELAQLIEASSASSATGEPPAIKPVSRQAYRVKRS
jgi:acyl carrier protein